MTDETPPPESCAHNLYRAPDISGAPEPSDLCRNALGVFHMLDCPLFLGRPCTYYAADGEPRGEATDAELEAAAHELRRDFLGWGYTQRVRGLSQPQGTLPAKLVIDAIAEPDEDDTIAWRAAADDGDTGETDGTGETGAEEGPDAVADSELPADEALEDADAGRVEKPAPTRPEMYPGQRRSEDRGRRKRRRPGAADVALPAAGDTADAEADDDDDCGEGEAPPPAPRRPLTVEELLDQVPEAPLPDKPPREEKSRRGRRGGRGRSSRGRAGGGRSRDGKSAAAGGGGAAGGDRAPGDKASGVKRDGGRPGGGRRRRGRRGGGSAAAGGGSGTGTGGGPRPAGDAHQPASPDGSPAGSGSGSSGKRRRRRRRGRRDGGDSGGAASGGGDSGAS